MSIRAAFGRRTWWGLTSRIFPGNCPAFGTFVGRGAEVIATHGTLTLTKSKTPSNKAMNSDDGEDEKKSDEETSRDSEIAPIPDFAVTEAIW
jgi:hypothetical protein